MDKLPKQAVELEELVLGTLMSFPDALKDLQSAVKLTPEMFYKPAHQIIYEAILKRNTHDFYSVSEYLKEIGKLEEVGGAKLLLQYTKYPNSNGMLINHAKIIIDKYISRRTGEVCHKAYERSASMDDPAEIIADVTNDLQALIPQVNDYESYKIDPLSDLTEPPVYCSIDGRPSMTAGNFTLLIGKAKSGKTFFLGSLIAAMLNNSRQLSIITGSLPPGKRNILYFDTEQSHYHANRTIKRICSLTGDPNPANLTAYSLRPFTPAERLSFIDEKISKTPDLGAVAIDGIRDLLTFGINDEPEATILTSKFMKWTAEYKIHLIILLHQNKNDQNARGHIGSECIHKTENTISISKDKSDIFIVSCDYGRDISFDDFGFIIDDGIIRASNLPAEEKAMTKKPQFIDDQKHFSVLDSIFRMATQVNYSELQDAIIYGFDNSFGRNGSRAFITHYLNKEWIIKNPDGHKVFYKYNRATF